MGRLGVVKGFRDGALQILFPLTLAWGSFWVLALKIESVFGLIPVSEEHWLHDALEVMMDLSFLPPSRRRRCIVFVGDRGFSGSRSQYLWHG